MRKVDSRLAVVLAAVWSAGQGCTSESTVPDVPGPDEPRTVALELANCAVSVPPIVHWQRWEGRTVFDATDPIVMCDALEMLRARMAARPVRFDDPEDILDLQPAAWDQISHVYLEIVPPVPPPPPGWPGQPLPSRPRLQLCAEVPGRSHRFCVIVNTDGTNARFVPGHR